MSMTIQVPVVTAAEIVTNPVPINTKFTLTVIVTEAIAVLEPYYYYVGDIYAGEV